MVSKTGNGRCDTECYLWIYPTSWLSDGRKRKLLERLGWYVVSARKKDYWLGHISVGMFAIGNLGDEEVISTYDVRGRNVKGGGFCKWSFKKKEEHITYKSGKSTLPKVSIVGESVATQHCMLVCRINFRTRKKRIMKARARIQMMEVWRLSGGILGRSETDTEW